MDEFQWKTKDGKNVLDLHNPLENRLENTTGTLVLDKKDPETGYLIDSFDKTTTRTIPVNFSSSIDPFQQVYKTLSKSDNANYNVIVVNNVVMSEKSAKVNYDLHQVYQMENS